MRVVINISKERIKKIKQNLACVLIVAFALSLVFSFLNVMEDRPCKTYGYYLPVTFIMCNLNKDRSGIEEQK